MTGGSKWLADSFGEENKVNVGCALPKADQEIKNIISFILFGPTQEEVGFCTPRVQGTAGFDGGDGAHHFVRVGAGGSKRRESHRNGRSVWVCFFSSLFH